MIIGGSLQLLKRPFFAGIKRGGFTRTASWHVDMITNVSPDDFATVEDDPNLQLLPSANPNILYLAMTNTFEPFDNPMTRKAIAMGIDREHIVDNFYPAGSEVSGQPFYSLLYPWWL